MALGHNPIAPPGYYFADPAARNYGDGKLYLYCSVDDGLDYYCSHSFGVMSTDNMLDWEIHDKILNSNGPDDEVRYTDYRIAGPDCIYKDGKYHMYYCTQDKAHRQGVALSESPVGPFKDGTNLDVGKYKQIDGGAFIDDDGQAYFVWGQFTMKMAKILPGRKEFDVESIRDNVLTEEAHFFHEGACMTKRNGIYYIIYVEYRRGDVPTTISYATSKSPMGPYAYGGVIIDNRYADPWVWNNHGSIAELDGQWYVFYHRSTHGTERLRRACVEPIRFNPDGSIDEVEMTSQGAGPALKATQRTDAFRACLLHGKCYLQQQDANPDILTNIHDNDRAAFKYLDFGDGVTTATIRVKPGRSKGKVLIGLDRSWVLATNGTIEVPEAGSDGEWQEITIQLTQPISGIHALWLTFETEGDGAFEFQSIVFS